MENYELAKIIIISGSFADVTSANDFTNQIKKLEHGESSTYKPYLLFIKVLPEVSIEAAGSFFSKSFFDYVLIPC